MLEGIDRDRESPIPVAVTATGIGPARASADLLVADISEGLTTGRFAPGQRLSEPDLMSRYGVSRGPVREALRRLQAEGVVTLSRHRGAAIRLFSRTEMVEILELIEVLAGLSARLVALRIADERVRESFESVYAELIRLDGTPASPVVMQVRDDFFGALIELSGSDELARVFPRLQLRMMRLQVAEPALEAVRFDEYRQIGRAILGADAAGAETATRRHFRSAVELFSAAPMQR